MKLKIIVYSPHHGTEQSERRGAALRRGRAGASTSTNEYGGKAERKPVASSSERES